MNEWRTVAACSLSLLLSAGSAVAQETCAQPSHPAALADRALPLSLDPDSAGLQELAATIGDARIVLLGEPWHGDGAAIRLRAELVEWLHQKMGFDVLVFESDFYSLTRGWERLASADEVYGYAAESLYPFWSTAAAIRPLWDYVADQFATDRPLRVAGVGVRHTGAIAIRELPVRVDSLLAHVPGIDAERRERFRGRLEAFLVEENPDAPTPEAQRDFRRVLDAAIEHLSFAGSTDSLVDPLLHRAILNLRNETTYAWSGANRDALMGENFQWIAGELYPDRKIIVWAHNNHLIEDKWMYFAAPDCEIRTRMAGRSPVSKGGPTYLGDEIRHFAGPDVVSIATLTATGRYTPDISRDAINSATAGDTRNEATRTAPDGTLEAALAAHGPDVAFIPFRGLEPGEGVTITQALDYTQSPPRLMEWDRGYDGFLFIRETFPVTESRPVLGVGPR